MFYKVPEVQVHFRTGSLRAMKALVMHLIGDRTEVACQGGQSANLQIKKFFNNLPQFHAMEICPQTSEAV